MKKLSQMGYRRIVIGTDSLTSSSVNNQTLYVDANKIKTRIHF